MKKEKKWEAFHYQLLKELFSKGESISEMAKRLDATQADIRAKLNAFGLRRPRGYRARKQQGDRVCMITVRVTESFHAEFAKACEKRGVSLNQAAKAMLETYVNHVRTNGK